jgi:uroporphyrinogen decarboxylase
MRKAISERDNTLRALEFRHPAWVPINFDLMPAVWMRYGRDLEALVRRHPLIFGVHATRPSVSPGYAPFAQAQGTFRDDWGCLWRNAQAGLLGQVVEHPLADWRAFDAFRAPDPRAQMDWPALRESTEAARRHGLLTQGGYLVTQGGFFDRLQFLRGLENLLVDFLEEPPQLARLIERVLDYNLRLIRAWLDIGVDQMCFHGDLGTQRGLMISPATFRRWLKPAYKEMFGLCRQAGSHVWYSSDGNLLEIVDDLVECGVTLHDPQVRANTVEGIARAYRGRLCALVDIDEQMLPFCTPEDIYLQMREVVAQVGTPQGGLMIYAIPSQDVPLENIEALCTAWERYCV